MPLKENITANSDKKNKCMLSNESGYSGKDFLF